MVLREGVLARLRALAGPGTRSTEVDQPAAPRPAQGRRAVAAEGRQRREAAARKRGVGTPAAPLAAVERNRALGHHLLHFSGR